VAERLSKAIKEGDRIAIGFAAEALDRKARGAAKAGYTAHPLVQEWMAARRSLGEQEALRKLQKKLPGVSAVTSPQLDLRDIWLRLAVEKIRADGNSALSEIQAQAKALCAARWLPSVMKAGLVHEDHRMLKGRNLDPAEKHAMLTAAADARDCLFGNIKARLNVTDDAFADWLIGLGLHTPRTRQR
jgi:hypothetical protein